MGKRNKAANPSDPRNKVGNQGAPKNMPDSIPKQNIFVFAWATKGSVDHLRGWDCVTSNVREIKGSLRQPKSITSTKLRRYFSTVSQTAALSEVDIDWLAYHLGHDVRVLRDFYHLHHLQQSWRKSVSCFSPLTQATWSKSLGKTWAACQWKVLLNDKFANSCQTACSAYKSSKNSRQCEKTSLQRPL